MADLIAQGVEPQQRWRRSLQIGRAIVLGRSGGVWTAPWDEHISRQHAEVCWDGRRLEVRQLPQARNPIFVHGHPDSQFTLVPGEHFVIGNTSFILAEEQVQISLDVPQPVRQQVFTAEYLKGVAFRHTGAHIDVLSRLPEVIAGAANDAELYVRFMNLVLTGIPRASAAALVTVDHAGDERPAIDVLQWDRRLMTGDDFQPSQRLILEAVRRSESVLHVWSPAEAAGGSAFTLRQGIDWAFCTPVGGKACHGWGIYVAGRFATDHTPPVRAGQDDVADPTDLRDDLKFTELAGATLGALRDVWMLERERAGLSQFFSPVVMDLMEGKDPEAVLAPREALVSIIFCDLRGFSRHSERSAHDLFGLLERVSRALGVTTHHIRAQGGVLGDFHGDAAMGFWGWPLAQSDDAVRAAMAALAIRREFTAAAPYADDPLADFRPGVGIATGRAVAGKIGTVDQVKVTVFGPVVNLASRLEGMTRLLHAPILLDEESAAAVRRLVPHDVARLRRVGVFQPYGLETPHVVFELLPPQADDAPLSDEHLTAYEAALDSFVAGRWDQAQRQLGELPAADRVKDYLLSLVTQHGAKPPADWRGVIVLASK